jgi:hypothetical protein
MKQYAATTSSSEDKLKALSAPVPIAAPLPDNLKRVTGKSFQLGYPSTAITSAHSPEWALAILGL